MPIGRRRGGREQGACPRRIERFLESCLLLLLHCDEVHGYDLLEGLRQFGFSQDPVDSSTIYRMLRGLEERGFVTSRWDTEGGGPARRLYRITGEGDRYLGWWVDDLRETDQVLHNFLERYGAHMEVHQ
jgi:PadR family transcriptional regulator PadR